MNTHRFSLHKRVRSFSFAFSGLFRFFRSEHNAWLHLAATVCVLAMALWFRLSSAETIQMVFAIGFVWSAELFNTCVERIMDFVSTDRHPQIKFIKDMAAGAVLVAAITSLIIGAIIFIPKIF